MDGKITSANVFGTPTRDHRAPKPLAEESFSSKIDRLLVGLGEYAAACRHIEEDARIGKVAISLKG